MVNEAYELDSDDSSFITILVAPVCAVEMRYLGFDVTMVLVVAPVSMTYGELGETYTALLNIGKRYTLVRSARLILHFGCIFYQF